MSLQSPSIQIISRNTTFWKKRKRKNKSPLARKSEKAGQAKIRTFPLSRKSKKGWQAKIRKNKKKENPADYKTCKGQVRQKLGK